MTTIMMTMVTMMMATMMETTTGAKATMMTPANTTKAMIAMVLMMVFVMMTLTTVAIAVNGFVHYSFHHAPSTKLWDIGQNRMFKHITKSYATMLIAARAAIAMSPAATTTNTNTAGATTEVLAA